MIHALLTSLALLCALAAVIAAITGTLSFIQMFSTNLSLLASPKERSDQPVTHAVAQKGRAVKSLLVFALAVVCALLLTVLRNYLGA